MAYKTITLDSDALKKEGIASGTIYPGMLLERTTASKTVKVHATAGGNCQKLVAIEDENQGKEISEAYDTTTRVFFIAPRRGDVVLMRVLNGQKVTMGDFVESAGSGYVQKHTPDKESLSLDSSSAKRQSIYAEPIIGVALTTVDMTGSSAADPDGLVQIEII
jgi:hypothetical protein